MQSYLHEKRKRTDPKHAFDELLRLASSLSDAKKQLAKLDMYYEAEKAKIEASIENLKTEVAAAKTTVDNLVDDI